MLFLKYLLRLLLGHDPLIQLLKKQCISPGLWLKDLGFGILPLLGWLQPHQRFISLKTRNSFQLGIFFFLLNNVFTKIYSWMIQISGKCNVKIKVE